jgi:NAD(P)-dependent dehydrogenase (short-subunit alcohol dehydrogenase family)
MTRTVVVTGSAGGVGSAVRARLEADGHRVIGIDRRDAEIEADLAEPAGRAPIAEEVARLADGAVDGLVVAAAILEGPGPDVVTVNYFGAVATLESLRPLLARGSSPAAVVLSSNSTTCQAGYPLEVVTACLTGDEEAARASAELDPSGLLVYPATKLALTRWLRRRAVTPEWIGAGIRLNAVTPGLLDTGMTRHMLEVFTQLDDVYPIPAGRVGQPEEVAGLIVYLLGPEAGFFCGSVVCIDGGTEAALRPDDWPAPPVS